MLIVMILMRIWLVLSLSAAAPIFPIEDKAREDTASVDIVNGDDIIDIVNGDDIIDMVNGDDINSDALHSHSSENTNRYPRSIYISGDVNINIEGDHGHINLANIFGEDASHDDPSHDDHSAVDGGWSKWSEYGQCSKECGGGQQTRTRTCTNLVPQHNGRTCEQQNIGDPTQTKDCNLHDCGDGVSKCFSAEGCPLVQNNLITTLLKLNKEFQISFEFQPTQYITGRQNVLFIATGGNDDKKFALSVKDDGQLNPWFTGQHITTEKKYPIGQWHSVKFSQRFEGTQYFYRVKINEDEVVEETFNDASIFSDVKVYASGPGSNALEGSLRNLVITMEKTKGEHHCSCNGFVDEDKKGECRTMWPEGSNLFWCYVKEGSCADDVEWRNTGNFWSYQACRNENGNEEQKIGCSFNDSLVKTPKPSNNKGGGNKLVMVKPWYEWKDGKIPYYFKGSIIEGDKKLILDVMNEIEEHTCFKFIQHDTEPHGHHLEILMGSDSCVFGFSAYVKPKSSTKILLHSYNRFTDLVYCGNFRGGILHEMMHVFGIMHTHNRKDRDQVIKVHKEDINDWDQYKICTDCTTYRGIPYECDSIMHYGFKTSVKKLYGARTMSAKDSSTCHLSEEGPAFTSTPTPTKNDWKLLTIVAGGVCGAKKGYVSLGCWSDNNDQRTIPLLEGTDSRLDGNFKERRDAVEICFEVAKSRGYPIFAIQDGGMCLGASMALLTYKQQGPSNKCGPDGKGGTWANEVYNIEGSCEVHVGPQIGTDSKSATVSEGCECPAEVDKYNWLGGYPSSSKFLVTQNGQSVVVQRTDGPVGWGLDLAFMCVLKGSCEVYAGKSGSKIKLATVEEGCECPAEIVIDNWVGGHNMPVKFAVTQNGQSLEVQFVDSNDGWGMDLVFKCKHKHTGNYIQALKQLRITVHKLWNVVNRVDDKHVKAGGNLSEEETNILKLLNIAIEHLERFCSSENEDCTSKQILVSKKEIEKINESVNKNINENEKISSEFRITLNEKLEELDREATEIQQALKQQTGCEIHNKVNYFGNNLHSLAKHADSFYECSKMCGMTKGCKYWTFHKSEQDCWSKDSKTGRHYDIDAISGAKDCPKGNSITETIRILIRTINELKKLVNGFGRKNENVSRDETRLLDIMEEVTRNLKNHCSDKNGLCLSEELVNFIKELVSTFENIKESGKISSGFLDNFEEFAENLVLAAQKANNFIKQGPTSFTECKSWSGCSCGSESCTKEQICTDAKCLNECEVTKGEQLLTEDCFCPADKEEGQLCRGGIDICTDLGCLDTSHHAFFFLLLG